MSTTLRDCVAEFVDKPPGNIQVVMIHLRRAIEREPHIRALEAAINTPLEIRDAVEGASLIAAGHPTECGIDPGLHRTAGEIGCAASHLEAYRAALKGEASHLVVFEDDCVPSAGFKIEALQEYLRRAKRFAQEFQLPGMQEFTLLSTCGCYRWKYLTRLVKATNHFNGSHAYIISRSMMQKVLQIYDALSKKKKTAPIDGVIPILLREEMRWAFCPEKDTGLFQQNREIPSYVVSDGEARRLD